MGLHCQCNVYPMFIQCNVYALKIQKSGRTTIVDQVIRERSEFDECSGFSPAAADRLLTVLLMALSLWLWQLVPKIWTNFFLLQLLTTFGTRRRFLKRFASVVRYQCIFYPSSTAHQLMVVQSITILKVFRWLTTGVRRTLCFFSWCHHFLATTGGTSLRGKFSSHRSIDTDDDYFLPFDTDGVLRRLAAKMGRFLWSIPSVKKARQKACHVTIARSAPRLSRFFGLFALRRLQRRELEI